MLDSRTFLLLSLLVLLPLISSDTTTTTSSSIFIRRKSPSSSRVGGGRLSLMNNRFTKRPKKKNLDPDQLLEILGTFYDPAWMSIGEPEGGRPAYIYNEDGWQQAELMKQLQLSNLSQELTQLNVPEVPGVVKSFEKWLIRRASCPVRYAWEDIGALFWPRYIRRGECVSGPSTCSWPPGMHCVPSGTTTLHVLRWQCKVPKGKGGRRRNNKELKNKDWQKNDQPINLKCSWIRVPYPIIKDCLCTC